MPTFLDVKNILRQKIAEDTTPEYWRKNIGTTEIFGQKNTAYFKAFPKNKLLDPEKHYNLPSIEKIYQKGNLPQMQTQNKTDFQNRWDSLLAKYKGNNQKNYFDIPTDLGGIKLPIRFDNDFFIHIQKEDRETWINILKNKWFYTFLYVSATLNVQKNRFFGNIFQKPLFFRYKKNKS
jgi:hypothetical protein